ncbi:isocitrate/isopropylmalate dehydrogenase family protein, partial [Mesorhizobium sp. M7A.F.Ca.CA.001.09.1.1]
MRENSFRLAIMPGDGIGVEVMEAATAVLEAIEKRHDIGFKMERVNGGARQ